MKANEIATALVIMAVVIYTVAVINFSNGDIMNGISGVMMACSDIIIAWVLTRQQKIGKALAMLTVIRANDGEGEDNPEEDTDEQGDDAPSENEK